MPILWHRMGEGTQTNNVAFAFPTDFAPAPWTYIFLIRNQNAGTWTPTDLVQIGNDTASSNRMSVWRVTGPNPALRTNATTALIQWVAVGSQEEGEEIRFGYSASNTTPSFPNPGNFATHGFTIVVWGANSGCLFNNALGMAATLDRTTHTTAKPSACLGSLESPVDGVLRITTGPLIEHTAALRMAPPTFVPLSPEIWNGTRWVSTNEIEVWNKTRWRTDGQIFNGTRWVPLRQTTAPTVSAITTTGSSNWDDQPQFFQVTTTGPVSQINWTFQNGTPATASGPPSGASVGPISWRGKPGTYQVVATVVGPGGTVQSTRDHNIINSSVRP